MKKKVTLLNPPGDKLYIRDYYCSFSSKADYYWPPQDLIMLSGLLDSRFEINVIDCIINNIKKDEALDRIRSSGSGAVIFTTGTATLESDMDFAAQLKNELGVEIIASAGIMKFIGREFMERFYFLDAVLLDFTEDGLISFLQGKKELPLKGLLIRQNNNLLEYKGKIERSFSVPVPRHDLFDISRYRIPLARRLPFAEVITSLGCPYSCAFCTAGAYGYKIREVDNVIDELRFLAELGVKEILFQDPTFTINTKRVTEICRKMVDNNLRFTWSCNADIKSMNEEKIKAMKEAGCHTVSVGIESGSDEILKKYTKMISVEKIKNSIRMLREYKIRVLGYFIIGLPGETRDSIRKTIDFAKELDVDYASFSIATPDIGTRLREEALEKGWIPPHLDVFDSTDFPVLETGALTKEEIWKLHRQAVREFYLRPSYLIKQASRLRSWSDVKMNISNAISLLKKS